MAENPKASSTPRSVRTVKGRPGIRDFNETVQSPIPPVSENTECRNKEYTNSEEEHWNSLSESDNENCGQIEHKDAKELDNTTFCNCISSSLIVMIGVVICGMMVLYCVGNTNNEIVETPTIEDLSQEFPSQVENFWQYFEVGMDEITKFQQPRTFIFLYTDESYETLLDILKSVSKFAVCELTDCQKDPLVLEGNDLNTTDILEDYGKIISIYKGGLEESGVMIVKNLDKIPGLSAQAFHSFCDEYNPVVQKALFIFTMKVDQIHTNNMKFLENYLLKLWHDIKEDTFYPLFTRISGNVLTITSEKKYEQLV